MSIKEDSLENTFDKITQSNYLKAGLYAVLIIAGLYLVKHLMNASAGAVDGFKNLSNSISK
jgi:hypothetical protein